MGLGQRQASVHLAQEVLVKGSIQRLRQDLGDNGSKITVKATYKEDTTRFKFEPTAGCFHLYEEVAKRFKLQMGEFQLNHSVKFLVRDMPCVIGSSGSSNCFLTVADIIKRFYACHPLSISEDVMGLGFECVNDLPRFGSCKRSSLWTIGI
ncbi:unnamed protein product [Fraxinus pennsylvanica]|uniref:Uncharacterized protein n=1 Tax=Fraxinus pennsylvanica TaxID=56036 RepID=A0AAD2A1A0_9LAMI|nr:unnamed protein product [Fraxinus pennsylvanica]